MRFSNGFRRAVFAAVVPPALLVVGGCQTLYFGAMEKIGFEKREILVDRVDDARKSQEEAKEQFESALEQFIAVTGYSGGDIEKQYRILKGEYEDSAGQAAEVRERIDKVEEVAEALFEEWEDELGEYSDQELRRVSERKLKATRASYSKLIAAMKEAEEKIEPVLSAFNDRVLFLKHNLNANAIASLRAEKQEVETDIHTLIADMNKPIAEADRFIQSMTADR